MIDYWSPHTYGFPSEEVSFSARIDTDLYTMAKATTQAGSLEVSPDGSRFVTVSTDRKVRVFRFASGKLMRAFDESLEAANDLQRGKHGEPVMLAGHVPRFEVTDGFSFAGLRS